MMPLEQHPLLGQLLRKVGATPGEPPPLDAWRELLGLMSQMCYESDQDREQLERTSEISSRDMQRLYQDLKRRAESERVEQDAIMRATLESAIEGVLLVDNNRNVIAANRRFAEMWRLPESVMESRDQRAVAEAAMKRVKMADVVMSRIDGLYDTDATLRDELELIDGCLIE